MYFSVFACLLAARIKNIIASPFFIFDVIIPYLSETYSVQGLSKFDSVQLYPLLF